MQRTVEIWSSSSQHLLCNHLQPAMQVWSRKIPLCRRWKAPHGPSTPWVLTHYAPLHLGMVLALIDWPGCDCQVFPLTMLKGKSWFLWFPSPITSCSAPPKEGGQTPEGWAQPGGAEQAKNLFPKRGDGQWGILGTHKISQRHRLSQGRKLGTSNQILPISGINSSSLKYNTETVS